MTTSDMENGENTKLLSSEMNENETKKTLKVKIWPYMVLISCFVSYVMAGGFNYGIVGSITEAQLDRFNIAFDDSSWTGSVHAAAFFMTAPFSAMLTRIITIRKVQLMGTILSLLAVGLSSAASEVWQVTLFFGLMGGVGLGTIRTSSVAISVYHFEKEKLNFATGATMLGFCMGLVIFPVPTSYLFETYGFSKGMLILTPLMLIHLLGVATYTQDNSMVAPNSLPETKTLKESLQEIVADGRVWAYLGCAFCRKFGLTGFFEIIDDYVVTALPLTLTQASQGTTVLGVFAIIGSVTVLLLYRLEYSKLVPHSLTTLSYGVLMICVTLATNRITYLTIMALLGLSYGVQLAIVISVANELVGSGDMTLVFAFELFMQGAGSLTGGAVTSYLQAKVGDKYGVYACGVSCIVGGLIIAGAIVHKHVRKTDKT